MTIKSVVTESGKYTYDNFHFSQATVCDGMVYCSGVVGSNAKGRMPDSLTEEFENAWRAIGEILTASGSNYGNIVEYTSYHIGMQSHIAEFMQARDKFVSDPWPSWTAIGTTELAMPGAHVEIRVIAKVAD
jgi:enamine deaminase RidA (YjgF/YER057c/UK114 family)